jgi:hypothetical protein
MPHILCMRDPLGAPASRRQQSRKNRVFGKQLYINNDDGVSVSGWAAGTSNAAYFLQERARTGAFGDGMRRSVLSRKAGKLSTRN